MRISLISVFYLVFCGFSEISQNSANLFCSPQCQLPDVGHVYCQRISMLLQCKTSESKGNHQVTGKAVSIAEKRKRYECGCAWLSTLEDLKGNAHLVASVPYINCQKISELSCERFRDMERYKANKTLFVSQKLFNFTNQGWIKDFWKVLSRQRASIRGIKDSHKRRQQKEKLASLMKDVILATKNNPLLKSYSLKTIPDTKKPLKVKDHMHYEIYRNGSGHYISMGSHVFNLRDPNWVDQFLSLRKLLRQKILTLPDKETRQTYMKTLNENMKLFMYAVNKDRDRDLKTDVTSSPVLFSKVNNARKVNALNMTGADINSKKGTKSDPPTNATTGVPSTGRMKQLSSKNEIMSALYRLRKSTWKNQTKSDLNRLLRDKPVSISVKLEKKPITNVSINGQIVKPYSFKDPSYFENIVQGSKFTHQSDGWTRIKDIGQVKKKDIIWTLQKRRKPLYVFVGVVFGITVFIVCLLCVKPYSEDTAKTTYTARTDSSGKTSLTKRADDRKTLRTANTHAVGDLDYLLQSQKKSSCWEIFCSKCWGKPNSESQPIVLYPDIKSMKKNVYKGQLKPKLSSSADNYVTTTPNDSPAHLTRKNNSVTKNTSEDFRMFHNGMIEGFGMDLGNDKQESAKTHKED